MSSPDPIFLIRDQIEKEFIILEKNVLEALEIFRKNESTAIESSSVVFRHAFFSSVYSFMEHGLRILALTVAEPTRYKRRVNDYDKVYQYYDFLINDMQLDKKRVEEDWEKLNIFRDIRNSIVHYNGTILKNINSKSFDFIENDPRVLFEEPRSFKIIDDGLILELIEVSKRFLKELADQSTRF